MGTHPSLPSSIVPPPPRKSNPASLISLSSYLSRHTALLGNAVYERYGADAGKGALPFLFKVLSIGKALSIQAHPDQKLAQKLHKEKPDMYKGRRGSLV